MDNRCIVVIPVYRDRIAGDELASFIRCVEKLSNEFTICLAAPESLDIGFYQDIYKGVSVHRFPDSFFSSYRNYNKTCKSVEFYEAFSDFKYILVYQLDSWIFEGDLNKFLDMDFDYLAAPVVNANGWGDGEKVGCGGLSLRKVEKFLELTTKWDDTDDQFEDVYFSVVKGDKMNIADPKTAMGFCMTSDTREVAEAWYRKNGGQLPMFCHKFNSNDTGLFWRDFVVGGSVGKASLISFANSDSGFSPDRVRFEAGRMNVFTDINLYSEHDFDGEYWEKNKDHFLKFPRGYGYMSWKPYFIKKKLSEMEYGDVLVYMDMGCTILPENRDMLLDWIFRAKYSRSGILSPCFGPYFERNWSKGDIFNYINENYNKDGVDIFENAVQCGTGVLVVCKNERSVEFVDRWNDIMENHFEFCTDLPSKYPNHPQFVENRHDQSVFSMLSKIYGIETIPTEKGILDKEHSPIICTRCKNDAKTWKKPITVLYDNQIFDLQKFGGMSRVFVELMKNTDRSEVVENFTGSGVARGHCQRVASTVGVFRTENENLIQAGFCNMDGFANNHAYLSNLMSKGDFDIFFPTFYYTGFLDKLNGKPFVMFIPDMITELYPQFFPSYDIQNTGRRQLAPLASAILVPTENTKYDVVRLLEVSPDKVYVIGHGLSEGFGEGDVGANRIDFPYILYVGHRAAYKKFFTFLKNAKEVLERHPDLKVLCTGPRFTDGEIGQLREMGLSGKIAYTHPVNDVQMARLYKYAKMFVYTSEYEGFGIPILEAYKMDCPVLLNSKNPCFKEVAGDAAIYYDNDCGADTCGAVERALYLGDGFGEHLRKMQRDRLAMYSWRRTGDIVTKVFENVCGRAV